jgi:hypothetical protein
MSHMTNTVWSGSKYHILWLAVTGTEMNMVRLLQQGSEICITGIGIRRQNLVHLLKEVEVENSEIFPMSVPQNV